MSLRGIACDSAGDATSYSGTMDLRVRFRAGTVSAVVKDLMNSDGRCWQCNFADVERIVLDDANLQGNAVWSNAAGTDATVFYAIDSELLRPIPGLENSFKAILLGPCDYGAAKPASMPSRAGTRAPGRYSGRL